MTRGLNDKPLAIYLLTVIPDRCMSRAPQRDGRQSRILRQVTHIASGWRDLILSDRYTGRPSGGSVMHRELEMSCLFAGRRFVKICSVETVMHRS